MPKKNKNVTVTPALLALSAAIQDGEPVYITESLSDAFLLKKLGLPAICGMDPDGSAEIPPSFFTGARVTVLHSNTEAGFQFAASMKTAMRNFAHLIRSGTLCNAVRDNVCVFFLQTRFNVDSFVEAIYALEETFAPWIEQTPRGIKVNNDKLAHTIAKNVAYLNVRQPGDGKQRLFLYRGGVYQRAADADMQAMIRHYLPVGLAKSAGLTEVEKMLLCREDNMHTIHELDTDTEIINFQNGLLRIATMELENHTPEVYSTLQISCNYDPNDQNMPVFRQFLTTLFTDDEGNYDHEREAVLQEFCGLAISNLPGSNLKKVLVLYSPEGNTGKSQVLGLLNDLVGMSKVANISMQDMGSGNRFSLGQILESRLICVGDQGGSIIRDTSTFRELTGSDPVKVEQKYKDSQTIRWNGAILFACNTLPAFKDDLGTHMFGRFQILPCYNVIPEAQRDPEILNKILKEKPAVINWMLQGLRRLMNNGYQLSPCAASDEVMKEYRLRQDSVYAFISACYSHTKRDEDRVEKSIFQKDYSAWCEKNDIEPASTRDVNHRLRAIGLRVAQARFGNRGGIIAIYGLRRKEPTISVA